MEPRAHLPHYLAVLFSGLHFSAKHEKNEKKSLKWRFFFLGTKKRSQREREKAYHACIYLRYRNGKRKQASGKRIPLMEQATWTIILSPSFRTMGIRHRASCEFAGRKLPSQKSNKKGNNVSFPHQRLRSSLRFF
jgi:hypothetical protein